MKRTLILTLTLALTAALFLVFSARRVEAQQPALTLYFPILVSQADMTMGIAVANTDTGQVANVEFTAYNNQGALLGGPNIQNPARRTIAAGSQFAEVVTEIFGSGFTNVSGWIRMTSDNSKARGFFLLFDPALNVMDGADVGPETPREAVLPEVSSALINVVNPNDSEAIAVIRLRGTGGDILDTSSRVIPGRGRLLLPATTVFGISPAADNYVTISSESPLVPFSLMQGITTATDLKYISALNGQAASSGGTLLYCPQFVNGDGYASEMNIVNLEDRPGQVTLRYIRDNGTQIGNTVVRPIAALGMIKIVGPSDFSITAGEILEQGYVVVESNGPRINGSVKFGDPQKARFQSALPFVSTLRKAVLFSQVAQGVSNFFTGAAVLNPNPAAIRILIEVFDSSGVRVASGERTIVPNGRVTVVLSEIDPALVLSKGYFRITSADNFASFAVFGTGDLAVLSAIPPQIP